MIFNHWADYAVIIAYVISLVTTLILMIGDDDPGSQVSKAFQLLGSAAMLWLLWMGGLWS